MRMTAKKMTHQMSESLLTSLMFSLHLLFFRKTLQQHFHTPILNNYEQHCIIHDQK